MIRLDGKTALVTGAGSGIGQCIAETFARAGAWVLVAELRIEAGEVTVQRIREAGGRADAVALDVTSESDLAAAAARYPGVDVLVCNAGIGHVGTLLTTAGADFDRVMAVNVRGVFNTMKAWLPGMVSRGAGSVVNLASTAGLEGLVDRFAYSVSKHAVVGITRCVALEASPYAVTVNAICPGFIQTDMVEELKTQVAKTSGVSPEDMVKAALTRVPLGRVLNPSEIAGLAVYLGSAESSGMTGQSIHVDGGMVLS
jgi:NAD(P)-dependent dehydrogenase (short-subunit alcohol dehydrogenase family)